jgi:hypothetical protein
VNRRTYQRYLSLPHAWLLEQLPDPEDRSDVPPKRRTLQNARRYNAEDHLLHQGHKNLELITF